MDELYLDNIDEYVNDHNKIVTYKWLSLTLGVHVNTAKQMLFHYLDHKRKESSVQFHATYLVSGKFVDNGQTCHKVSVVREDQLEDCKAKMSLIASVHVYSVQKALLKDSGPLYAVDYDAVRDNLKNCSRYTAIRCSSAVPMSSVELQQVKDMQRPKTSEPEAVKMSSTNGHAAVKPQKGIMGMFVNKTSSKTPESTKELKTEESDSAPVEPKSKPAPKAKPTLNFFGNQTKKANKAMKEEAAAAPSPPPSPPSPPAAAAPSPPPPPPAAAQSSSAAVQPVKKLSHREEKQEATVAKLQKESKSKTKRIEDSDSEEEKMEKKKRKRIKKPEPDSSDEEVIPDSPQKKETQESSQSPEKQPTSPTRSHPEKNPDKRVRKRRRVLKSRTFVDEEGCIVTEKGYESESYSESEEEFKAPKQAVRDPHKGKLNFTGKDGKKGQKKTSANNNKSTKQASIMGFLQKK